MRLMLVFLFVVQLSFAQKAERPSWLVPDSLLCHNNSNSADTAYTPIRLLLQLPAGKVVVYPLNRSYSIKVSYNDLISVCLAKNSADDMRDYEKQIAQLQAAAATTDTIHIERIEANDYIIYHLLLSGRAVIYEPISHTNTFVIFHRMEEEGSTMLVDAFYLPGNRFFFSQLCRLGGGELKVKENKSILFKENKVK